MATAAPGTPGHGHAVAGGDVGIGRVEIDLAAAAGGQQRDRRGEGLDLAGLLVEDIDPEALVVAGVAELLAGDQVNREVVLEDRDVRLVGHRRQQGALDFAAGDVLGVEDAALGMAALPAEVELARAVRTGYLALGEMHAQLDQLRNARRAILDDRAHGRFLAQAGARFERVAHVQFEGVLLARDGGDAALGVVGIRLGAVLLGDDRHAPVRRDFQRKRQPGNAAAQDKEIELLHRRALSINRVLPMNTASAMCVPRATLGTGTRVSGSKNST